MAQMRPGKKGLARKIGAPHLATSSRCPLLAIAGCSDTAETPGTSGIRERAAGLATFGYNVTSKRIY